MANFGPEGYERLPDLIRLKAEISGAIESKCAEIEKRLTEQLSAASSPTYQMSAQDVRMSCVSLVAKERHEEDTAERLVAAANTLADFVLNGLAPAPEKSNG